MEDTVSSLLWYILQHIQSILHLGPVHIWLYEGFESSPIIFKKVFWVCHQHSFWHRRHLVYHHPRASINQMNDPKQLMMHFTQAKKFSAASWRAFHYNSLLCSTKLFCYCSIYHMTSSHCREFVLLSVGDYWVFGEWNAKERVYWNFKIHHFTSRLLPAFYYIVKLQYNGPHVISILQLVAVLKAQLYFHLIQLHLIRTPVTTRVFFRL